jgi:phage shock protein C
MDEKRLVRPTTDRMIAGVAAGLANYMNMDPTIVRLLFVLLGLAGGPGILIYIIMWIVMPEA